MTFIAKMTAFMAAFFSFLTSNDSLLNALYEKLKALYDDYKQYKKTVNQSLSTLGGAIDNSLNQAKTYTDEEVNKLTAMIKSGFNGYQKIRVRDGEIYDLTKALNNGDIKVKQGQYRFDVTILDANDNAIPKGLAQISLEDKGIQVLHQLSSDEKLIIDFDEKGIPTIIGVDDNEWDILTDKVEEMATKYEELEVKVSDQTILVNSLKQKVDLLAL